MNNLRQTEIKVGQVWKRRVELFDDYDVIRVGGKVDLAPGQDPEWTVEPAYEFGQKLQTSASGILEHCDLVEDAPDKSEDWCG
jgi:hypothetical protein